jgi:hypothetical protein
VIGEECHIEARSPEGPRGTSPGTSSRDRDAYDNLILLCRNCHRLVDENPGAFPVEALRRCKNEHEAWVANQLEAERETGEVPEGAALRVYYQCFDRYAFRDPMCHEEPTAFIQAVRDTRIALTTGVVRLADGEVVTRTLGKSQISSTTTRDTLDRVVDRLRDIERRWDSAIARDTLEINGGGAITYDDDFLAFMDDTRNKIIDDMNSIFAPLGLTPHPRIELSGERSRGYTTGHLGGRSMGRIPWHGQRPFPGLPLPGRQQLGRGDDEGEAN